MRPALRQPCLHLLSTAVAAGLCIAGAPGAQADDPPTDGQPADVLQRSELSGDWGGARPWLEQRGVAVDLSWTGEVLGNATGGLRQGTVYDGVAELGVDFDFDKMFGWQGALLHASGYSIQGRGLSTDYVGNLLTVSSIEAPAGWRLNEVYLEQSLAGDALSVRAGQIAADTEFWLSDTAGVFINSTFGWPGINGTDLPGGGPSYPAPTPGVRVRWTATEAFSLQGAVFNGDPAGDDGNHNGLEFPIDNGVFAILEAAYAYAPKDGLAGTWKVGAWVNSNDFDNLSRAKNGRSLASPRARGGPRQEQGDWSLYGIVDHQLWREGGDGQGLSGFARVGVTPQQDRNPIWLYLDTGLAYTGPLPGRDDDIAGLGFALAQMSPDLARLDRKQNRVSGVKGPVADFEAVVEATYQAALTPAVSVQPFAQLVFHPGGNVANPNGRRPTQALKDAAVFGLRTAVTF